MSALKLIEKEFNVAKDGKSYVTVSGLARLAGVSKQAVSQWNINLTVNQNAEIDYESMLLPSTKNEKYISDIDAARYISEQAGKGNKDAVKSLIAFSAIGLRSYIQSESGYSTQQSKADLLTELREAQRKLAFCSIHEDCPKAVFEERNNQKVSQLKQAWIQAGWIDRVAYSVVKHKEVIKGDGHDYLYEVNGQIRVKQEAKQEAKLITHGVLLGLHGQSDILAFD